MKKLKIAVWHNLPSGGGKRQLYYHVKGLIERGHYVESWCPDTADQKFLPLGNLLKEHIIPLALVKDCYFNTIKSYSQVRELIDVFEAHSRACAEQINAGDFDVLYANACIFFRTASIAQYVNLPSAIYLGEPYRWFYEAMPELAWIAPFSFKNLSINSLKEFVHNQLRVSGVRLQANTELQYARAFDRILVNSVYSRESVLRAYNLDAKVCYLGIDADYYHPTGEPKENIVVGLGTIYHAKGVDRAIRAVGTIPPEIRPTLVWIGNGALPGDLHEYECLSQKLNVQFVTKVNIPDSEVISLLSRATAMLYTSRLEPFGLAPLEANACGTVVVGIAEGGVKESICDGVNGFLVPDDDPVALGGHLRALIESPALARNLGLQAREHVLSEWNFARGIERIEEQLQNLFLLSRVRKSAI